jgi:hypothetical protein
MAEEVAPRLGGIDAGERFIELLEMLDGSPDLEISALDRIRDETLSHAATFSGDVGGRWLWLAERASRRIFSRADKPADSPW